MPPTTTEYPEDEPINPLRVQGLPKENLRQKTASKIGDFRSQFFASQYPLQFGQPQLGQLKIQPAASFGRLEKVSNNQNNNDGYLPPRETNTQEVENVVQNNYNSARETGSAERQVVNEEPTEEEEEGSGDQSRENKFVPAENGAQYQGQYYILAPDNTLQRVNYRTIQTEEDVSKNGFRAQLQYEPVEPVKPPVYGYNEEGQLIRIYRKK